MKFNYPERGIRPQFLTIVLAIVAILVLGLIGGLLHHHESESESATCFYCHTGLQTPVFDLASALVVTTLAPVGVVTPARFSRIPCVIHFSRVVPRAPPVTTLPVESLRKVGLDLPHHIEHFRHPSLT